MAFLAPPAWLENSTDHNAQDYRTILSSLLCAGVAGPAALAVSERAGTPNMSVDVAAGGAFIASTRSAAQGTYHAYNDAVINTAIAAADATNPRIDRILLQVRDEAQDGALTQNDARIFVEQGTPAAVPVAPTVTIDDYIELAQVTVPASASSITNSNISDTRPLAASTLASIRRYTTAIATAQVTSGGTELTIATLQVPAQPFAYELDVRMFATLQPSSTDDADVRIKVGGVAKAETRFRGAGTNQRWTHAIPCIEPTEVAAGVAVTITVTLQRGSGTGTTSTVQFNGRVTAEVIPQR